MRQDFQKSFLSFSDLLWAIKKAPITIPKDCNERKECPSEFQFSLGHDKSINLLEYAKYIIQCALKKSSSEAYTQNTALTQNPLTTISQYCGVVLIQS